MKKNIGPCYRCKNWKNNKITQHTGMAICSAKKKIVSYLQFCEKFTEEIPKSGETK